MWNQSCIFPEKNWPRTDAQGQVQEQGKHITVFPRIPTGPTTSRICSSEIRCARSASLWLTDFSSRTKARQLKTVLTVVRTCWRIKNTLCRCKALQIIKFRVSKLLHRSAPITSTLEAVPRPSCSCSTGKHQSVCCLRYNRPPCTHFECFSSRLLTLRSHRPSPQMKQTFTTPSRNGVSMKLTSIRSWGIQLIRTS